MTCVKIIKYIYSLTINIIPATTLLSTLKILESMSLRPQIKKEEILLFIRKRLRIRSSRHRRISHYLRDKGCKKKSVSMKIFWTEPNSHKSCRRLLVKFKVNKNRVDSSRLRHLLIRQTTQHQMLKIRGKAMPLSTKISVLRYCRQNLRLRRRA